MDSASKTPAPAFRQRLFIAALVAGLLLLAGGLTLLQRRTAVEVQARKNPTAQAFESQAEQWLAHPREASVFERALRAGEVVAVGVDGSLVLYTDRAGQHYSTRLIDCGNGAVKGTGARRSGKPIHAAPFRRVHRSGLTPPLHAPSATCRADVH